VGDRIEENPLAKKGNAASSLVSGKGETHMSGPKRIQKEENGVMVEKKGIPRPIMPLRVERGGKKKTI